MAVVGVTGVVEGLPSLDITAFGLCRAAPGVPFATSSAAAFARLHAPRVATPPLQALPAPHILRNLQEGHTIAMPSFTSFLLANGGSHAP